MGGYDEDGATSTAVITTSLDMLSRHHLKWHTHQDTPWCLSASISVNGIQLLTVGGYNKVKHTSNIYKFNKLG